MPWSRVDPATDRLDVPRIIPDFRSGDVLRDVVGALFRIGRVRIRISDVSELVPDETDDVRCREIERAGYQRNPRNRRLGEREISLLAVLSDRTTAIEKSEARCSNPGEKLREASAFANEDALGSRRGHLPPTAQVFGNLPLTAQVLAQLPTTACDVVHDLIILAANCTAFVPAHATADLLPS